MYQQNGNCTPCGNSGNLKNPPSNEADSMDCGGSQTLLATSNITNENISEAGSMVQNPFARNSRILRSPVLATTPKSSLNMESMKSFDLSEDQTQANNKVSVIKNKSALPVEPTAVLQLIDLSEDQVQVSVTKKKTALSVELSEFLKLKEHINYLVKMFDDPKRRSIVQQMRDAAKEAENIINNIEGRLTEEPVRQDNVTQTSPWLKANTKEPKRKQMSREKESPDAKRSNPDERQKDVAKNKKQNEETVVKEKDGENWKTVVKKKKVKKVKKKRKQRTEE
jgi:hypothetical protein